MAKGKVKHGEARAEARRRNRLAAKERVVAEATGGLATASDSNASVATKISPTTISAAQGTRTGFRAALRSSFGDRKSTRLNSSHMSESRMPSSA